MKTFCLVSLFAILISSSFAEDEIFEEAPNLRDIKTLTPCSAQLDDGTFIDLSSLSNVQKPRSVNATDFVYQFNPCDPIPCANYPNSGICQSLSPTIQFNLGDQKSASFSIDKTGVVSINFATSDSDRTTHMQCICGDVESFQFVKEDPKRTYYLIFISPCCCPNGCNGTAGDIVTLSPCKAKLKNGQLIDLSSLSNPSAPRISQASKYKFSFNPCDPIPCSSFTDAGICQQDLLLSQYYNLGSQQSATFSLDKDNNVNINFASGIKKTTLQCVCGQTESFQFVRESPLNNYLFIFISPCCCPDGCKSSSITTLSPCKASLQNGKIIDLSSLSNSDQPMSDSAGLYSYTWNPCDPISCITASNNSASCQLSSQSNIAYEIGTQSSAKFEITNEVVSIRYESKIDQWKTRTTNVKCLCTNDTGSFKFLTENPQAVYNFQLNSRCCCPNGCQ